MNILTTIAKIISAPLIGVLTLAGYPLTPQTTYVPTPVPYEEQVRNYVDNYVKESIKDTKKDIVLGAAPDYFAGTNFFISGSGVSSSATSITLTSLTISQTGQKIVTGDLIAGAGNKFYITIQPGDRLKQEVVSCTTITQNSNGTATLSGCSRGLSPITPYTSSTTLQYVHGGGSTVIFSNPPNVYRDIISYIDNASIAGAVDGSATVKGIFEKATASEAASHAGIGSGNTTAPLVLTTDIASSTRSGANQVVVVASTTGYIDSSFFSGVALTTTNNTWVKANAFSTSTVDSATTTIGAFPAWEIGKHSEVFSSSGTFRVPTGITRIHVILIGGGGGGGSVSCTGANQACGDGGGGSGGYAEGMIDVSATTSIGVTIGTGGAAESNGGASYFGSYLTALGGSGTSAVGGGAGGSASGGNIANITGMGGGDGVSALTSQPAWGGQGGSNPLGIGGQSCSYSTSGGASGVGYGSGGAGACGQQASGGTATGGSGTTGRAIITW